MTTTAPRVYAGEEMAREMFLCADDFRYFLQHAVFIRDVQPDGGSRVIPWEWWGFHDDIVRDLAREKRLVILKARQLGFSWLLAALHVHGAMFTENYLGGVTSAGQKEASSFLDKCKFIVEHLPWADRPTLASNNTEELRFTRTGGAIFAYPSTAKGGIGETFNRFVADEAAHHQYGEENYAEYEPATEYGQIIIVSSMGNDDDKQVTNDWFERHWKAARDGLNGFTERFYPWTLRPSRDEAWKVEREKRLSGKAGSFARSYPETPEDAFRSMVGLRFHAEAVEMGRQRARPPLREVYGLPFELEDAASKGFLKLWSGRRSGVPYVAYTDPAEGKGRDFTVTVVLEARTLKHVATLRENVLTQGQHGSLAVKLCRWFNDAYWGVERAKGEEIALTIGMERYPRGRLYYHQEEPTFQQMVKGITPPAGRFGFPMTEHTRVGLIDDLDDEIVGGGFSSEDEEFWRECGTFVINPQGKAEASRGNHDDVIIAISGGIRMARQPGAQSVRERPEARAKPRESGYSYRDPRGG